MQHRISAISKIAIAALAFGASLGAYPGYAAASSLSDKGDAFLNKSVAETGSSRVIVKLRGALNSERASQISALGGDIYRRLPIIDSVAVSVPKYNLEKLAALDFVIHLSSDATTLKTDEFTCDHSGATAAYAAQGLTGQNVTVAVLDSGIRQTADFNGAGLLGTGSRVVANVNFVPATESSSASQVTALSLGSVLGLVTNLTNPQNPADDTCGHGTHVAGIIGGNGSSSSLLCYQTFYGVARRASLVNVRVLDGNGVGDVSQVIAGIQWVVSNKSKYSIRVLNISLGHAIGDSFANDPLCQACEAAWKAGIVVVCAAGNEGRITNTATASYDNEGYGTNYGSINSPGNDPYVITVGAMKTTDGLRKDDRIATYSSRGPSRIDLVLKPDICAPGNQVISVEAAGSNLATTCGTTNQVPYGAYSALPLGQSTSSNQYFILSGTSMATPVVSGAIALMLQANPSLTPDTIKERLMVSADKWLDASGNGDPLTYGSGYVDVPAALASKLVASTPALSPSLSVDAAGNVNINLDGTVWSTRAVWGSSCTNASAVYGSRAVWGSGGTSLSDSRAVWGSSVEWDDTTSAESSSAVDLSSVALGGE